VEALYLVCGARRPQLKRNPLGGIHMTPLLTQGLVAMAIGLLIAVRQRGIATPQGTEEQLRRRRRDFRLLGIILILAGAALALSAVLSPS
jgi:hypothetical protein